MYPLDMVSVLYCHFLLKVVLVGFEPWTKWSPLGVYSPELYDVYYLQVYHLIKDVGNVCTL